MRQTRKLAPTTDKELFVSRLKEGKNSEEWPILMGPGVRITITQDMYVTVDYADTELSEYWQDD